MRLLKKIRLKFTSLNKIKRVRVDGVKVIFHEITLLINYDS